MDVKSRLQCSLIRNSSLPIDPLREDLAVQLIDSSFKTAMCSLLLLLNGLSSNSVHVHDSLLGECLAHGDGGSLRGVESRGSDKSSFLELHEAESDILSSSSAGMLWLGSISALGAVMLAETVDTDLLAHVKLIGN